MRDTATWLVIDPASDKATGRMSCRLGSGLDASGFRQGAICHLASFHQAVIATQMAAESGGRPHHCRKVVCNHHKLCCCDHFVKLEEFLKLREIVAKISAPGLIAAASI
jgi:hypothetical protein